MDLAQFFKLLAGICWEGTRALTALSSLGGMYLIGVGPKPNWSSIVLVAYVMLFALTALVGTGIFHCLASLAERAAAWDAFVANNQAQPPATQPAAGQQPAPIYMVAPIIQPDGEMMLGMASVQQPAQQNEPAPPRRSSWP